MSLGYELALIFFIFGWVVYFSPFFLTRFFLSRRCTHPNPTALPYRASWSLLVPRARLRSDPTQPRSTLFLARFFLSRRHTHPNPTALPYRAPHGAARATTCRLLPIQGARMSAARASPATRGSARTASSVPRSNATN